MSNRAPLNPSDMDAAALDRCRLATIGFESGKIEDIGGNIEDIGGKIEDIGGKIEDVGGKIEDIGGKIEDIGRGTGFTEEPSL